MCTAELALIVLVVDEQDEQGEEQIYLKPIHRFRGGASGLDSCFETSVL